MQGTIHSAVPADAQRDDKDESTCAGPRARACFPQCPECPQRKLCPDSSFSGVGGGGKDKGQSGSALSQSPSPTKGPHIHSPVEFEAAFVLNVVHQVTPIEELHHEEQVVLEWGRR